MQREKRRREKKEQTSKNCETTSKDVTYAQVEYKKEKIKERINQKKYFEVIMAKNFPKLMTDTKPQTHQAGNIPNIHTNIRVT